MEGLQAQLSGQATPAFLHPLQALSLNWNTPIANCSIALLPGCHQLAVLVLVHVRPAMVDDEH